MKRGARVCLGVRVHVQPEGILIPRVDHRLRLGDLRRAIRPLVMQLQGDGLLLKRSQGRRDG